MLTASTTIKRLCLTGLAIAASYFGNAQAAEEVGVGIKPTSFEFTSIKGQTSVQTVTVINSQPLPVQLKFYLGDWLRDSTGQHKYFDPGTLPVSCAKWIKLSREFVEVPANSSVTFDMTMTVPDSVGVDNIMRWAMLFVEGVQETEAPKPNANQVATSIVRKQRIGLHIYNTPPAISGKDLKMVSFQTVANRDNTYRITCDNTGNLQIKCKPYLELTSLDESGKTTRVDGKEFPMFPGQRRIVDLSLPTDQPKGKYNVIAAVDAGEDIPLEAAQAEITVK